jgi:hypothetical protein
MPTDEIIFMFCMVVLFISLVVLVAAGIGVFTNDEQPIEKVNHTMDRVILNPVVVQAENKNWKFTHCTPTNKDCGRLE